MRKQLFLLAAAAGLTACGAFQTVSRVPRGALHRPSHKRSMLADAPRTASFLSPTRRARALEPVRALPSVVELAESVIKTGPVSSVLNNLSSVLVLALIVAVHELGHFLAARSQGIKVDCFSIGFGPTLLSYKSPKDEIEYTLRLIPMGGFVSFPKHYEIDSDGDIIRYEDKDLLQNRPPLQQALVIVAGIVFNVLFSFSLLFGTVSTVGLPRPQFSEGPYIVRVIEKDCPAALAGVQADDILLSVNGKAVSGDDRGLNEAVSLIAKSEGRDVDLQLRRKGAGVISKSVKPRVNEATGRSSIGVQMASHVEKVDLEKAKDLGEAITFASREFGVMLQEATSSITRFTQSTSLEGLTGPLGIVQVGADLAAVDPLALIKFSAFISLNLAVVNALPVPGLDGGQMIFVLLEMIRGRKMDIRTQNAIQSVAVLILASLSFYLLSGDVTRGFTSPIQRALESGQVQVLPPPK